MTDDPLSWMEPPRVPKTRPCPRCDGLGVIVNPDMVKARALLDETIAPLRANLEKSGIDVQQHIDRALGNNFLPLPCRVCKATGQIPMEQPGDPSQVSPRRATGKPLV